MELTKQEKEALKFLLKKELKEVKKSEKELKPRNIPNIPFLALEEKYEIFLEKLLKKLK